LSFLFLIPASLTSDAISQHPVIAFSPLANAASVGGIYGKVWATMTAHERDPFPGVSILAKTVMENIRMKAREAMKISASGEFCHLLIYFSINVMIDCFKQFMQRKQVTR